MLVSVDEHPWWASAPHEPGENRPQWWPAEYAQAHPYWHVWQGVAGLLYGRRLLSSPPKVVRAQDPEALRRAIEEAG